MTITGLLPPTKDFVPYTDNIAAGTVEYVSAQGVRTNVSTATNGDDIWAGTATTIPIPASVGVQMTIVSTSVNDTSLGTGIQIVELHYIDANGNAQSEDLTMNGVTPVNTVATNIRFVNDLHTDSVGTGGGAAGTISLYLAGAPATIYTVINAGHFRHSNTARMVPLGKTLLIESCAISGGAAAGGKSAQINLRTTAHHGILLPVSPNPVFNKELSVFVFNSSQTVKFDTPLVVPSLAVVKCTSYATSGGADIAANWYGKFVTAPV